MFACPQADGPKNLEQPSPNDIHNMAFEVDPHMFYRGQVRAAGQPWNCMNITEYALNNSISMLWSINLLENSPWKNTMSLVGPVLGKVSGVEEFHQYKAGPLRYPVLQLEWTSYNIP